jgi:cysteine desulfuration protein SufE
MSCNFEKNIENIKRLFDEKNDAESKYLAIIELGRKLPSIKPEQKIQKNKIIGCQSTTYLCTSLEDGSVHFFAESDSLISSGLIALLIMAYNLLPPEIVINNPPTFLTDLGIHASLSVNRANGLEQMYRRMKEDVLKLIKQK